MGFRFPNEAYNANMRLLDRSNKGWPSMLVIIIHVYVFFELCIKVFFLFANYNIWIDKINVVLMIH